MTPAEITSIEGAATEIEEVARSIFMENTSAGSPEEWLGNDEDKHCYRMLMEHVTGLRAMVERCNTDADQT